MFPKSWDTFAHFLYFDDHRYLVQPQGSVALSSSDNSKYLRRNHVAKFPILEEIQEPPSVTRKSSSRRMQSFYQVLIDFPKSGKANQPVASIEEEKTPITAEVNSVPVPAIKPPETAKPEEPPPFLEKPCPPAFIPPKPIPHSPKISPSSIPNPNPSVTTTKQVEPGYPTYGGYMYSVPGYSAFQPVSYPGKVQPTPTPIEASNKTEKINPELISFPIIASTETTPIVKESDKSESITENKTQNNLPKIETDFEEQFTPEIISAVPVSEPNEIQNTETKMSVTSLAQGSGATVTIPAQTANKDIKKKPSERFSLKTSIPISKIDMKCVNNPPDMIFQNNLPKKPFNPAFHTPSLKENGPKIEIQSNIVIKSASKESDIKEVIPKVPNNSISTLINAAEAISKSDNQFKTPESKQDVCHETKDSFLPPSTNVASCPIFNPINFDANKANFQSKAPESSFNEPKNQIVLIQNKNSSNAKMLLAIQQQNPQVLVQRTNFDPKNLQAPSRPSNQSKKCKEELVNENGTSSKVVSLKRMHQDNCDENDFENLITENQIYGNKIVVKEKSQGTLQEQDLKSKSKGDKFNQPEPKNVVLQPNFVYLSNVQFPANLMMIKNNTKQNTDTTKIKAATNENKQNDTILSSSSNDSKTTTNQIQNIPVSKEIHVLKSNSNVLQALSCKNGKPDLLFQSPNQKVIMNPQIVYQVPMIVDTDNKLNQTFVKGDYSKLIGQNKRDIQKQFEQTKVNDKLYIACPYQMDSKLQPKIVITNIRPKITKIDEISALDIYEQKKRMRRLKYLSNRDPKTNQNNENQKIEMKKSHDNLRNVITPENMKAEIYKEFTNMKINTDEDSNESDSDCGEDELNKYNSIIEEYGYHTPKNNIKENKCEQAEFLANFSLATKEQFKEKELDRQEKIIRRDAVASAYIAAGRIDCLKKEEHVQEDTSKHDVVIAKSTIDITQRVHEIDHQKKIMFLTTLNLTKASPQYIKDYEKVWQEIEKERRRRDGIKETSGQVAKQSKLQHKIVDIDPSGQLQILSEIKQHVNENNNLIKKRFDSFCEGGDSIRMLAEKNFSELNRLSKMADRSVKLFSGQNSKKRDLNPGFDSENIQIQTKPGKYYPDINIPNISKVISLKTTQSVCTVTSTQATSMDEPENSAAVVNEMLCSDSNKHDFSCQVDASSSWTGIEAIMKTYKEYEIARKREINDLHRRNTSLRVESAHITRAASRDSDRARALLAERRNLANEERVVRNSIQWLYTVVDIVRNYEEKLS